MKVEQVGNVLRQAAGYIESHGSALDGSHHFNMNLTHDDGDPVGCLFFIKSPNRALNRELVDEINKVLERVTVKYDESYETISRSHTRGGE